MIKKISVWCTDTNPEVCFTTRAEAVEEEKNQNKSYVSDLIALIDRIQSEYDMKKKELEDTFAPTIDALHNDLDDLMNPDGATDDSDADDVDDETPVKASVVVKVKRIKN